MLCGEDSLLVWQGFGRPRQLHSFSPEVILVFV